MEDLADAASPGPPQSAGPAITIPRSGVVTAISPAARVWMIWSYISRTLEATGARARNQTLDELCLNDGLGTTRNPGRGDFCARVPAQNHIRQPSLRDPEGLEEITDRVRTGAEADRKYGYFARCGP